jgi:hypothetical protein
MVSSLWLDRTHIMAHGLNQGGKNNSGALTGIHPFIFIPSMLVFYGFDIYRNF